MVRGRRVRTIVACAKDTDNCDSPKRKDQRLDFTNKLTQNGITKSQIITDFFQVVHIDETPTQNFKNDLILHDFQVTPVKTNTNAAHMTGMDNAIITIDDDKPQDDTTTTITPHRIQLMTETQRSPTSALSQLHIALPPKRPINTKVRRKLNGTTQSANNGLKSTKDEIKNNHTLTEYFPVRRSIRKTKRIVQEEKQRNIEHCIRKELEEGLEVHNFIGKGRGIVACQPFARGDFVVEYYGELIDISEAKRRELKYAKDQTAGCYMYYFRHNDIQYCIDATAESGRLGRLVNHSRNGNLMTKTVMVDGLPRLVLIAKDNIAVGEEVTYDYGDRSRESLRYHPWLAT